MPAFHPCPDGILRPGYASPYYPYFFSRSDDGQLTGIFVDYFRTLTQYLGCERLDFRKFSVDNAICSPEECVNVLDGTIESGEIFTLAVSSYFQYKDVYRYAYTINAVADEKIIFIEGRPSDEVFADTRLVFFTVFNYGALLAVILAIFLTICVHYTRKGVVGSNKISSLSWGDVIGSALVILGFALITTIWNAAYNGNNSVTSGPRELTITQGLQQIQSGLRKMLVGNSTTFYEGDEEKLFDTGNYTLMDSINERLEYLCSNPDTLSMFYTPETYRFEELSTINRKCRLHKILPGAQRLPTTWLDKSVRSGDNFNFVLAKNTSRSTIEKMSWLLLTVYSADNQATIHLRRLVPNADMAITSMTPPTVDGTPFSIPQIEMPLIFYFVGIAISFGTLAVELICMPFIRRMSKEIVRDSSFVLPV